MEAVSNGFFDFLQSNKVQFKSAKWQQRAAGRQTGCDRLSELVARNECCGQMSCRWLSVNRKTAGTELVVRNERIRCSGT